MNCETKQKKNALLVRILFFSSANAGICLTVRFAGFLIGVIRKRDKVAMATGVQQ